MIFVMNNKTFNVRSILAGEAPKDAAITVKGWVRTRRELESACVRRIFIPSGSGGRAEYAIQLRG